ncbi:DNA primase large subunit PriL [uncultured archaeon]|nr:DNA primase large subunit PriL [uncultured archaeon]
MESGLSHTVLARYPFLTEAKAYVAGLGLTLDEIVKHPVYSIAVEKAGQRLEGCVKGGYVPATDSDVDRDIALLSYPLARVAANLSGSPWVIEKYAAGEAETTLHYLTEDDNKNPRTVDAIAAEMGLEFNAGKIHILTYLKSTATLARSDPNWKLANRQVNNGFVEITRQEFRKMIAEEVRKKIMEPTPIADAPPQLKRIGEAAKLLNAQMQPRRTGGKVTLDSLPKKYKHLAAGVGEGQRDNALTSLIGVLKAVGLTKEEALKEATEFCRRCTPPIEEKIAQEKINRLMK